MDGRPWEQHGEHWKQGTKGTQNPREGREPGAVKAAFLLLSGCSLNARRVPSTLLGGEDAGSRE